MSGRTQLHSILILVVSCTVADEVLQFLDIRNAIAGQTVTFHCSFPLFKDKNKIVVHWWKDGEREFLNSRPDPRRRFRVESKASAMLSLLNVRVGDSGVYYCRVQGEFTGNGTGKMLNVSASPHPLKILPKFFANGSLTCLCKTSGFYPADYTIAWQKDGQKIVAGVTTFREKNADGLFEVSSYLHETRPVQIGTIYICEVSHSTLKNPTWVNYTVSSTGDGFSASFPWWIYLCGAISLLLLIILLVLCCKFCKCKARKDNIQMRHCVRCSEPIMENPKCKEQAEKLDNAEMPQRNQRVGKVNDTAPKLKKHRKRDKDTTCA
ncbi:CD276 antigen homolog isoform X1 [Heterodontus francisci]|uniref:CD276 antigen homolog isoform X1 n=1 Tax=Heterodontus francisci TaxID=7792 RepID=UPI00355B1C5F